MTALKPIDARNVRGVLAKRYPINAVCAHPECDKPTESVHHIFPRSMIGNSSWFVEVAEGRFKGSEDPPISENALPHAIGLCGSGTTGHHGDLEEHRAWIRLEDGVFVWYDRIPYEGHVLEDGTIHKFSEVPDDWQNVGPLDPQPGGREKSRKRRRKLQGEERRKRRTISLRVPDDTEDGGAIWDETLEETKSKLVQLGLYSADDKIPNYEAVIAALRDWLNG